MSLAKLDESPPLLGSCPGETSEKGDLLSQLEAAVSSEQAAFCCGGTIPIATGQNPFEHITADKGSLVSPPIVIRWDLPNSTATRKLTLPAIGGADGTPATISELLRDCSPATFGHKGKEVLDETYRKAAKLDSSQFSTSFSPHDYGIVDAIAQTLLPEIAEPRAEERTVFHEHGIIAELYKLNMSRGATLQFRPHVDTPRTATQFGSLVVCLPHPHQGGQLRISHKGGEAIWDWSNENAESIRWVAFYSDCEHEVCQVQSGHRLTLTYNLYIHERLGGVLRRYPTTNPEAYPLYLKVQKMLAQAEFLSDGGTLGFHCTHAYAHTNDRSSIRLPFALKGVDVIVYTVFRSLGLDVDIKPVLEDLCLDSDDEYYQAQSDGKLIGTGLHKFQISRTVDRGDRLRTEHVQEVWKSDWRNDITWLNTAGPEEIAVAYPTYGNEPGVDYHYSDAAMFIHVPTFAERTSNEIANGEKSDSERSDSERSDSAS